MTTTGSGREATEDDTMRRRRDGKKANTTRAPTIRAPARITKVPVLITKAITKVPQNIIIAGMVPIIIIIT